MPSPAVIKSMQQYNKHCEDHPIRPVSKDADAKNTAEQLNEIERRANSLRLHRYETEGVIDSRGAW